MNIKVLKYYIQQGIKTAHLKMCIPENKTIQYFSDVYRSYRTYAEGLYQPAVGL
jgi:hypothetical protein